MIHKEKQLQLINQWQNFNKEKKIAFYLWLIADQKNYKINPLTIMIMFLIQNQANFKPYKMQNYIKITTLKFMININSKVLQVQKLVVMPQEKLESRICQITS